MKDDKVRVIDLTANDKAPASPYTQPGQYGLPFSVSSIPAPNTIPISDKDGFLNPNWWADFGSNISPDFSFGFSGKQYFAPTVRLMAALSSSDEIIVLPVTEGIIEVGTLLAVSYYTGITEEVTVTGGPYISGSNHAYNIERGDTPFSFPKYSYVLVLGTEEDGGYMVAVSGEQGESGLPAPYIDMFAWENGERVRKMRIGRLRGMSEAERSFFPQVTNWNRFGIYAEDIFAVGGIHALWGNIAGNLSVSGLFTVKPDDIDARVEIGHTVAGFGIGLLDEHQTPLIAFGIPENSNEDYDNVFMFIRAQGEKAFEFKNIDGIWTLDIGPFTITSVGFESSNISIHSSTDGTNGFLKLFDPNESGKTNVLLYSQIGTLSEFATGIVIGPHPLPGAIAGLVVNGSTTLNGEVSANGNIGALSFSGFRQSISELYISHEEFAPPYDSPENTSIQSGRYAWAYEQWSLERPSLQITGDAPIEIFPETHFAGTAIFSEPPILPGQDYGWAVGYDPRERLNDGWIETYAYLQGLGQVKVALPFYVIAYE